MAFSVDNSKIYLVPFRWPSVQDWDRIAVNVTTTDDGSVFRLGVYLSTPEGLQGSRLFQPDEIPLGAFGGVFFKNITFTMPTNQYWLAYAGSSSSVELEDRVSPGVLGRGTTDGDMATYLSFAFSFSTGDDLPAILSSPTYETGNPPLIALRAA